MKSSDPERRKAVEDEPGLKSRVCVYFPALLVFVGIGSARTQNEMIRNRSSE